MMAFDKSFMLAGAAVFLPMAAMADPIVLLANEVEPISLPVPAGSIIIGNSGVADIIVQNKQLLLLTGRGFGSTQVTILDENGNELFSNIVLVQQNTANQLVVRRAGRSETYTCTPDCARGASAPEVQVPAALNQGQDLSNQSQQQPLPPIGNNQVPFQENAASLRRSGSGTRN